MIIIERLNLPITFFFDDERSAKAIEISFYRINIRSSAYEVIDDKILYIIPLITLPRMVKDKLIAEPSFNRSPVAPVDSARSLEVGNKSR